MIVGAAKMQAQSETGNRELLSTSLAPVNYTNFVSNCYKILYQTIFGSKFPTKSVKSSKNCQRIPPYELKYNQSPLFSKIIFKTIVFPEAKDTYQRHFQHFYK